MITFRAIQASAMSLALVACVQNSNFMESASLMPSNSGAVTVTGRVTSSHGDPIANAEVSIAGNNGVTTTDADGNYQLQGVAPGKRTVIVRHAGYATMRTDSRFSVDRKGRGSSSVDVGMLTPDEVVSVEAQRTLDSARLEKVGFNSREDVGRGAYFIDAEQIAAIHPHRISDIFRHVPVLLENPFGGRSEFASMNCVLTYVDGLPRRGKSLGSLETFMRANEIIGAEVYPPGQLPPPPFVATSSQENCTTLALWTRRTTD
jgi:Carboxypeptidase regulatory-like domain